MPKVLLMVIVGALALGQIAPSCGEEERAVVGWVERKFPAPGRDANVIVINHIEYNVPPEFYDEVRVGDLVKYENGIWTIVKKAQGG